MSITFIERQRDLCQLRLAKVQKDIAESQQMAQGIVIANDAGLHERLVKVLAEMRIKEAELARELEDLNDRLKKGN